MPGGLLFESFLVTAGRRSSQRAILALAKTRRVEKRECTAEEAEELVATERVGFHFNLLSVLANRGRSANRQLFFLSPGSGERLVQNGHGGLRGDEFVPHAAHV